MRLKLDENLPTSLEGLKGRPDSDVFAAAQQDERLLVTQDLDFSDLRRFAPGSHHGLLLVRLSSPGRIALRRRIHAMFRDEDVESWKGCFIVATDHKLRIRRPDEK